METDPHKVARLAKEREDENSRFRVFLTSCRRISDARLNALARRLGEQAARQMHCPDCGACCREIVVPLEPHEIAALATAKGLAEAEFRARYVRRTADYEQALDAHPCPLQDGTLCTVYEARPEPCRGYPYIGADVRTHTRAILERAGTCPIAFEMIEQLKKHLGFQHLR